MLAEIAGIDHSYMGGIERGEHTLAIMNLLKIADALGLRHGHYWARQSCRSPYSLISVITSKFSSKLIAI